MCLHKDASITGLRMSPSGIQICTAPMGDRFLFQKTSSSFQKFTTLESVYGYFNPGIAPLACTHHELTNCNEFSNLQQVQMLQSSGFSIYHTICVRIWILHRILKPTAGSDASITGLRISHSGKKLLKAPGGPDSATFRF